MRVRPRQCCICDESAQAVLTGLLPGRVAGTITPFCSILLNKAGLRSDTGDGKTGREGRVCAVHSSTTRSNFRVCGSRLLARVTSPVAMYG